MTLLAPGRLDLPGPLRRRGPRPLWLHLAPERLERGAALPKDPAGLDPVLLAGIAAYRRHPYQRALADPATIWAEGESRLLDYGGKGRTVLFVPSLVNRAYVLDLLPDRSLLRWLAAGGVRPVLLDWGWPGPVERGTGLGNLISGRLERALLAVARPRSPVVVAGYCMGGLLALALALRRPERVKALALLATPWDFHAADAAGAMRLGAKMAALEPVMAASGTVPIDMLQTLFASVEPGSVAAKFRRFAGSDPSSRAARDFVAIEDWLNDGVPLAAPVAREVFGGWYRENRPGRGVWCVDGQAVVPEAVRCPTFVAVPGRDRIVPPSSALPLGQRIAGAVVHQPGAGHVGMVAGPRAEASLWQPLLDWLRGL